MQSKSSIIRITRSFSSDVTLFHQGWPACNLHFLCLWCSQVVRPLVHFTSRHLRPARHHNGSRCWFVAVSSGYRNQFCFNLFAAYRRKVIPQQRLECVCMSAWDSFHAPRTSSIGSTKCRGASLPVNGLHLLRFVFTRFSFFSLDDYFERQQFYSYCLDHRTEIVEGD